VAIAVTHFTDPGCPWAYSARPAHAVLRWRYGDGLDWRLAYIGLTEEASQYEARGYTPARSTQGWLRFRRRYGMPFATQPRPRVCATGRACRALVAVRLTQPEREEEAFRALQFGWFTTPLVLDEDAGLAQALERVPGLDVTSVIEALADAEVERRYQADRAEARTAAAGPSERQGKTARTDGPVRYTAPSLVFAEGDRRLEAGGFQPVEAYDVLIANLDPAIDRRPPPDHAAEVLRAFPYGLTTQEVAAVLAHGNDPADRDAAHAQLIEAAGDGEVRREPLGDDALWTTA
jgi:2-hydroxychromene-2-carboxylate isomerase